MIMKPEVVKAINTQIDRERDASVTYEAFSIWCAAMDYPGFARFFAKQATEEREHAQKLIDHLLERQEMPLLGALNAPKSSFASLAEVAEAALAHEEANTKGVVETLSVVQAAEDIAARPLLMWFVSEQVEEEAWANKMVTLTKRLADPASIYLLDRHIEGDLGA
jgi:ferritin